MQTTTSTTPDSAVPDCSFWASCWAERRALIVKLEIPAKAFNRLRRCARIKFETLLRGTLVTQTQGLTGSSEPQGSLPMVSKFQRVLAASSSAGSLLFGAGGFSNWTHGPKNLGTLKNSQSSLILVVAECAWFGWTGGCPSS